METKWFLKSKTVIGLLITILPTVAALIGWNLSADDTAFINSEVDKVITGVGAVLSLVGRFKSNSTVTLLP